MESLSGEERARYIQDMFARISKRYDLMNRLMTAGQDIRWRREVIRRAELSPGNRLLDLGAGTGDLAREAHHRVPASQPVAADFTLEMMQVGKTHPASADIPWVAADALCLPFMPETYDAVVSGFLMRNVIDLRQALLEQGRVLRPGGRIVILDTTRPPRNLLSPFIRFYLQYVIPTLGRIVAGAGEAYTYLPDSTQTFLTAEQLAEELWLAGYSQVGFRRLMFGTVAIHWGKKRGVSDMDLAKPVQEEQPL